MSLLRPTTVQIETAVRKVDPDATAFTVRATFRYDPAEPYAVELRLRACGEEVRWTFARDLLAAGLDEPAGHGDVRLWPTPEPDVVALALSSPDGNALFEVPRDALLRFLRRSCVVVPRGREADHLDVDATGRPAAAGACVMAIFGRAAVSEPVPPDVELAAMRARVDQVLALVDDAFRRHGANRQLCDLALDVRLALCPQRQPDVPVVPGPVS
jgi:Streptomyces sporulation and cell division protein, SsgA